MYCKSLSSFKNQVKIFFISLISTIVIHRGLAQSELFQCQPYIRQREVSFLPNIPDFHFNDGNIAAPGLTAANVTYVFTFPTMPDCRGTVVSLEYCYDYRGELGRTVDGFQFLVLSKEGDVVTIVQSFNVRATPSEKICTFGNVSRIVGRGCCDIVSLNANVLTLDSSNFTFGVIVKQEIRLLTFSEGFNYRHYQMSNTISTPVATFMVHDSAIVNNSLLIMRLFVDHSPQTTDTEDISTSLTYAVCTHPTPAPVITTTATITSPCSTVPPVMTFIPAPTPASSDVNMKSQDPPTSTSIGHNDGMSTAVTEDALNKMPAVVVALIGVIAGILVIAAVAIGTLIFSLLILINRRNERNRDKVRDRDVSRITASFQRELKVSQGIVTTQGNQTQNCADDLKKSAVFKPNASLHQSSPNHQKNQNSVNKSDSFLHVAPENLA